MKTIIGALLAILVCSGCQGINVHIKRCEGSICSEGWVKSRYEFANGVSLLYDGEKRTFEFRANDVQVDDAGITAMAGVVNALIPLVNPLAVPE